MSLWRAIPLAEDSVEGQGCQLELQRCPRLGPDAPLHPRRRPLEQTHVLVDVGVKQPLSHRLASLDALVVYEASKERCGSASRKTDTKGYGQEGSIRTTLDETDALLSEVRSTVAQRSDDALDRPGAAFRVFCEEVEP